MGIRGHMDALRGKYLTALICDHNHRAHPVPVKRTIGDYFMAMVNGQLYVFSLKGARILTIGDIGSRQARFVVYDVSHQKSVNGAELKRLELCLAKEGLGKVDRMMLKLLVLLGREEAKQHQTMRKAAAARAAAGTGPKGEAGVAAAEFKPHSIKELAEFVEQHKALFPEEAEQLRTYLAELDIEEIGTPVRPIADYLQSDLLPTSPSFLSELYSRLALMDGANRNLNNAPKTSSTGWLKWGIVMAAVAGIVVVIGLGVQQDWFGGLGGLIPELDGDAIGSAFNPMSLQVPSLSSIDCSEAGIMARYATPLDLRIAVEAGAETCKLPEATQKLIEGVQMPRVVEAEPAAAGAAAGAGTGGGGG